MGHSLEQELLELAERCGVVDVDRMQIAAELRRLAVRAKELEIQLGEYAVAEYGRRLAGDLGSEGTMKRASETLDKGAQTWTVWFQLEGEPFSSDELMTEARADELADVIRAGLKVEPLVKDEG